MNSTEAIRAAIDMIQNAIDDDSLIADQAYAQEVITQLQRLPQMNESKYINASGAICPGCGSNTIEGIDSVETYPGGAQQVIICRDCKATWLDVYILQGYEEFSAS